MTTLTVSPFPRRMSATATRSVHLVPQAGLSHGDAGTGEAIAAHGSHLAPLPGPTHPSSRQPAPSSVHVPRIRPACRESASATVRTLSRRIATPHLQEIAYTTTTTSRAAMAHPRLAGATGAGHRTPDTVPGPRHLHIIGTVPARSSATMNTPHALDESLVDFAVFRRKMLRLFLRDQTLDSDERALLDEFDGEHDDLAAYRARQLAAHQFERNGDTRRTRDAFRAAGHNLVDLAAERQTRRSNVIAFPHRQDAG